MKSIITTLLLLVFISANAQNQNQKQEPVKIESKTLISGDTLTLKIDFNVQEDWMVYDSLADERGPIPLSFNNDAILNLELIKINKPKTKHKYDDIFEVDLWYFTNSVSYELCFKILNSDIPVSGTILLEYMSCNLTSGVCLPPRLVDVPVTM
ncbi:MAG: protein-disulfide reductase DsbD domain-containing protein [Flavobacteriales bacterium]